MKHIDQLKKVSACNEAVEWATSMKDGQSAWDECERGNWMLWLMGRICGSPITKSRKKVVLIACECARLSLKHVSKGEKRPLIAIETAESWARGEGATLQDVSNAADAAAYAAADAADAAADAAYAAADAAADAAHAAARMKTLKKCADIVRKHQPKVPRVTL